MQFIKKNGNINNSNLQTLQLKSEQNILTQSVESLDSFLPKIHSKNPQQLEIENRVVGYLRQLQIHFKTDPRKKEYEFYDQQKSQIPVLKQSINEEDYSPLNLKCYKDNDNTKMTKKDFQQWLNPFIKIQQFSKDF